MNGRLYRSRDERVIAGVAGGLADYFDIDPSLVRILWVLLALFSGGAFFIVYIVMAIVVPEEPWEGFSVPPAAGTPSQAGTEAPQQGMTPPGESPTEGAAVPVGAQRSDWRAQRQAWRAQRRAERAAMRARGERPAQNAGFIFGLILLAFGIVFLVPLIFPGFTIGRYWPVILVAIGLVLVIASVRPRRPDR